MSALSALAKVTGVEYTYTPVVIAAAQAVEALAPNASGVEKASVATSAAAQALAASSSPEIAAIAQQVNVAVAVLNLLGLFKHKAAPTIG